MSDEKVIPYKVQKGNRPKIEEVITCCLDGDLQNAALDFTAFMRENKMPFGACTSTTRERCASYKDEQICHIRVRDFQYWSVTPKLAHINKYEEVAIQEGLQNILWDNVNYCGNHSGNKMGCNPNKRCAGGRDFTILGKQFHGVKWCYPHSTIKNPDEAAIRNIKRLLELERIARDEIK